MKNAMAARVATKHLAAGARSTTLAPGAMMEGDGEDKGYFVNVVSANPVQGGNYWVEGYLRKGDAYSNNWALFHTYFPPPKTKKLQPLFERGGLLIEKGREERVTRILKEKGARLLQTLGEMFPADVAGLTSSYKGKYSVFVVTGPYREYPNPQDVGTTRKDRHSLYATKPVSSGALAEKALDEAARKYEQSTFPGGMATKLGLVYWRDLDQWSGVYETYYSFS